MSDTPKSTPKSVEQQLADVQTRLAYVLMDTHNKLGFARALGKLELAIDNSAKTLGTDGKRIYINYEYAMSKTDAEFLALFEHELMHVVLRHSELFVELDPTRTMHDKFNICADFEINSHVENLPGNLYFPSDYGLPSGKGTAWYWYNAPFSDGDSDSKDNSDDSNSSVDDGDDMPDSGSDSGESSDKPSSPNMEGCGHVRPASQEDIENGTASVLTEKDIEDVIKEYSLTGGSSMQDVKNHKVNRDVVERILRLIKTQNTVEYGKKYQARHDRSFFGRTYTKRKVKKYALYLDISGSMQAYWPYFQSIVEQVTDKEVSYVGMFSTELEDYDPQYFGGGTDIHCVQTDVLERDVIPIVFTDGFYARPYKMPKETVYVLTEEHDKTQKYSEQTYVLRHVKGTIA